MEEQRVRLYMLPYEDMSIRKENITKYLSYIKQYEYLSYMNFKGSINYNVNDNIFYGKVLDIVDPITYKGENPEELFHNFVEAVDNYINDNKKEEM